MKKLGIAVLTMAVVLAFVGVGLVVQRFAVGQITQCQAALVDQFVAAAGPRSVAADLKDQKEADMAKILLDPNSTEKTKRDAFVEWADAVESYVAVKAANPLPPPPTETCGTTP